MTEKIRISKSGRFAKLFPKRIQYKIRGVAAEYPSGIKTLTFKQVTADKVFHIGEGDRFVGIGPNGEYAQFEVVSSNTVGAAGLSHRIGETFQMPAGCWLIEIYYYNQYFMTVYQILPEGITSKSEN